MRQDPPFDLGYITATHLLERIQGETLVVNDPASVRNAPEKVWVLDFPQFMPPTAVTRSLGLARKFLAEHGEIVVKPLHGFAGGSVFRIGSRRPQPRLADGAVQPHLSRAARHPEIHPGDRRGRQAHRPGRRRDRRRDQPRSGRRRRSVRTSPSAARRRKPSSPQREEEICAVLGPELQEARAALRRHRRDRRQVADRDQRHLADGDRRHRRVQRHRHPGADLAMRSTGAWPNAAISSASERQIPQTRARHSSETVIYEFRLPAASSAALVAARRLPH